MLLGQLVAGETPRLFLFLGGEMYGNYPYQLGGFQQPYQPMQMTHEAQFMEVDGQQSLNALQMPPNQRRVYFDKHQDRFYTVETDAVGGKTIAAFDFSAAKEAEPEQYVTVRQFDEWRQSLGQLIQQQTQDNAKQPAKSAGIYTRGPAGGNA